MGLEYGDRMANIVDPESDLGPQCLLMPVCKLWFIKVNVLMQIKLNYSG